MKRIYKIEKKIVIASLCCALVVTLFSLIQCKKVLNNIEYDKIYNRTKRVYNTFVDLDNQVKQGKMSKAQAQKKALEIVEHYKFSGDSSYVWIVDFDKNIIFHPLIKDHININNLTEDYDKSAFEKLINDAISSDENHANVVVHKWKKHESVNNKDKVYNKSSVALKFEDWHWIIGTGVYSDVTNRIFVKFIWFIFATYLIFFVFLISIFNYIKTKSIENLIKNIHFVSWYKNDKGEYVHVNNALIKISPYNSEDELRGKHYFTDDISEEFLNLIKEEDNYVLSNGKMAYAEREIEVNGEKSVVQIFKVPIYDFSGKVVGIAGLHRDITEEKNIEKIQKEFLSVVSHELRTPLTSIIGSIQLILSLFKEDLTERVKNLLEMTDKNSIKLKKLVDNILDTSRLDSGRLTFDMSDLDLIPILNEAIKEITPYAMKYNVNIVFNTELENVFVHIDKDRFKQIIANLVSNAIKFSKKNSNIDIKVSVENNSEVKVDVINYEAFIPEDKISNLFKKFTQIAQADTRSHGGSGLGLYITKQLVENMDGHINVISNEDFTSFYVTFSLLQ